VPTVADALDHLTGLPGVADGVRAAREACDELRFHRAMRRRRTEAAAEAGVRAARASAALAGARYPTHLVRDVARGAASFPDDAAGVTALGAVRALAQVDRLGPGWQRSPAQALARLHVAAAAGVVPDEALGRPRRPGEPAGDGADLLDRTGHEVPAPDGAELAARLDGLAELLDAPASAPALLVAALAHAEIVVARPFVAGNAVVVWEAALLGIGPAYPLGLARYAGATPDGVGHWIRLFAQAVVDGAVEGRAVCDAVVAGRLPR
jgi:hypothetical protein